VCEEEKEYSIMDQPPNVNTSKDDNNKRRKRKSEDNKEEDPNAMQQEENKNNNNNNKSEPKRRRGAKKQTGAVEEIEETLDKLNFEDDYEDEHESESIYAAVDDDEEQEGDMERDGVVLPPDHTLVQEEAPTEEAQEKEKKRVWRPGQSLADGEVLEYDPSAYHMLHRLKVEWPLLSFSVLHDQLGFQRSKYPHTVSLVAGTQCDSRHVASNALVFLKLSNLSRSSLSTHSDSEDDESDDDDDQNLDDEPIIESKSVKHPGVVNRVKSNFLKPEIIASWSANGQVFIWSLPNHIASLADPSCGLATSPNAKPAYTFSRHTDEGYALDFSPLNTTKILTGGNDKKIYMLEYDNSTWNGNGGAYVGHTGSVEDLQFSPKEENVFASCSSDKTVKIWDGRARDRSAMSVTAHDCDVNVISWSKQSDFLIASGADDGSFNIWDLRNFKENNHVARMKWHGAKVSGIEWHPIEAPELVACGEDGQVTTWDLSLEKEEGEEGKAQGAEMDFEVPPQLLFVHQGQRNVKEVHWHPQIPGVIISTAEDGLNIYKSSNV